MEKDITTEVYNALADIAFMTGASNEELKKALDFFESHFFDVDDDEDIEE